jgi:hypothetical protein
LCRARKSSIASDNDRRTELPALPVFYSRILYIMEQLVAELKNLLPFKETTMVGDIVLIAAKKPQMLVYAKVVDIVRDASRKGEWWHVTMHLLSIPLQTVTWTLRTPQFTGQEIFTMGGEGRFMKAVHFDASSPEPHPVGDADANKGKEKKATLRIVK